MADFIFLMHDDASSDGKDWEPYLRALKQKGCFEGGSAIGEGVCVRKHGMPNTVSGHLTGYIRVTAKSLEQAKALVAGNPHYEAGGTVEIRELPRTD